MPCTPSLEKGCEEESVCEFRFDLPPPRSSPPAGSPSPLAEPPLLPPPLFDTVAERNGRGSGVGGSQTSHTTVADGWDTLTSRVNVLPLPKVRPNDRSRMTSKGSGLSRAPKKFLKLGTDDQ